MINQANSLELIEKKEAALGIFLDELLSRPIGGQVEYHATISRGEAEAILELAETVVRALENQLSR